MKTLVFSVWDLDMLLEGGIWVENDRHKNGYLEIRANDINDVTDVQLLKAMSEYKVGTVFGQKTYAIKTTDRRRVYAEDYYGDGTWWEIGQKCGHYPFYGLKYEEGGWQNGNI